MNRPRELINFYQAAKQAALARSQPGSAAETAAEKIFSALETQASITPGTPCHNLPAYSYLPDALDEAATHDVSIRNLSHALKALAPLLSWQRRPNALSEGKHFYDGHANTTIVGPTGLEIRSDAVIGVSLVAPNVSYPKHNHPPEEIYVVMSQGDWYRDGKGWYAPGMGTVVYHRPWVTHAMRSREKPLLAVWCLWAGEG